MIAILITLIVFWIGIGFIIYTNWWTKDVDMTLEDFFIGLLVSISGPFLYLLIYFNEHDVRNKVIIKKRRKK